ncbi:MAG TPA: phosphoribosyltransferase [Steroidobacteraceae bacterium]|nr:phosphoribosyltransferase [Steroidobacteraceae bacterium]
MQVFGQQMYFADRADAGRALARSLEAYARRPGALVLALPRGGVPVGYEVAHALDLALDVFLVRKLGVPGHEELAMGAIASGGVRVVNERVVQALRIAAATIDAVAAAEQDTLERRERFYRGDRPHLDVRARSVILVDDGLATGSTMRAALEALGRQEPKRLVAAVPVAPAETCQALRAEADEVVCLATPPAFHGVSEWYRDFAQTSDEEVRALLERAAHERLA